MDVAIGRSRRAASEASDVRLVRVAPAPGLAGLERANDRVAVGVSVPARVAVRRRVAAADVAARQAQAQVDPGRADAQALRAALRGAWTNRPDHADVGTHHPSDP